MLAHSDVTFRYGLHTGCIWVVQFRRLLQRSVQVHIELTAQKLPVRMDDGEPVPLSTTQYVCDFCLKVVRLRLVVRRHDQLAALKVS